jgi:hypothetical protein
MHAPNINPQDPRWSQRLYATGNTQGIEGGAQQGPTKEMIESQQAQNVTGAGISHATLPQMWAYRLRADLPWHSMMLPPAPSDVGEVEFVRLTPENNSAPPVYVPTDWDRKMGRLYNWVHENGLWEAFEDNVNPYSHLENRAKDEAKIAQELADSRFRQNVMMRKNQAHAAKVRAYLEETIEQRDKQIDQVKELLARMKQVLTGVQCAPESNGYISTTPVGPEKL